MSLLTLNGVEWPLTQVDSDPVRAGDVERSPTLRVRNGVRSRAWDLKCAVQLLDNATARAVRGLVEGEGAVLSFDSTVTATSYLWTSRGGVLYDADGTYHQLTGGDALFGAGALSVDEGYVAYAFAPTAEWTLMEWANPEENGWSHYVRCSDGRCYVDGVLVPPTSSFPAPSAVTIGTDVAVVWLLDSNGAQASHDEVVWLPYLLPADWVPAAHAFHEANAWPQLPYVLAQGAAVDGGSALVQGRVGTVVRTTSATPGSWYESFPFDLLCQPP